jgi:hypothetical protein
MQNDTETLGKRGIPQALFWIPIVISLGAVYVSVRSYRVNVLQWHDSHKLMLIATTPRVVFESDSNTDDPQVGINISNPGPAPATLKHLTYYFDRTLVGNVKQLMKSAGLYSVNFTQIDDNEPLAVAEKDWLLYRKVKTTGKEDVKDRDHFLALIDDDRITVEAEICSVVEDKCYKQCSTAGQCGVGINAAKKQP